MALKTETEFIEVRIQVPQPWPPVSASRLENEWLLNANEVAKQVKKHIDDIDGVSIHIERVTSCEYCGHREDEQMECCQKSRDELDAKKG